MDYEYASDDQYGGRVLWGRVAVYGVSLLLAFMLGSCVGGAGQVDREELDAAQEANARLAKEIEDREQTIESLSSNTTAPRVPEEGEDLDGDGIPDAEGEGGDAEGGEDGGQAAAGETRTYVVQDGDTLYVIAENMYGDGQKFRLIAEANDLTKDTPLRVGDELVIPPDTE